MAPRELYLYDRLISIKEKSNKDKEKNKEKNKGKLGKSEMISSLMSSNLAGVNCLHLANQYSRIVNSRYGEVSEAAMAEITYKEIPYYEYFKELPQKHSAHDSLIILTNPIHGKSLSCSSMTETVCTKQLHKDME